MAAIYPFPSRTDADLADTFTRADEDFPTAAWSGPDTPYGAYGGAKFGVRSNVIRSVPGSGSYSGQYPATLYLTRTVDVGNHFEASMDLPNGHSVHGVVEIDVLSTTGASYNGYGGIFNAATGWQIRRWSGGAGTVLASGGLSSVVGAGGEAYGLGLRRVGGRIELWAKLITGVWVQCGATEDDDYIDGPWSMAINSDSVGAPSTATIDNVYFGPFRYTAFPACPTVERGLRPDEAPIEGGWSSSATPFGFAAARVNLTSRLLAPASAVASVAWGTPDRPPVDAWVRFDTYEAGTEINLIDALGTGTHNGYAMSVSTTTAFLYRMTGGTTAASWSTLHGVAFGDGGSYGLRVGDGKVEAWVRAAGGDWVLALAIEDATHAGPFWPVLYIDGSLARFDRFGYGRTQPGRVWPTVLIDWDAYSAGGALIIGSGTIGTSTLGGYLALQPSFVHAESDVTRHVQNLSIQRGRADTNTPAYSGRLDLQLTDPDGRYLPGARVDPPGIALDVMLGVRVMATHLGDDYNLFTGYTTRARKAYRGGHSSSGVTSTTFISADDGSTYLSGAKVGDALGSGSVVYSGKKACELVDLWLRQVNVPWRNCGTVADTTGLSWTGYENDTVEGAPDPDAPTALSLIQNLLVADQGAFFFDAGGTATYLRRTTRYPGTATVPAGTITSIMDGMEPAVDIADLATRAVVSAGGTVNAEQAWTRPYTGPTDRYGYRDVSLSSDFIKDTSHLVELAYFALDTNTAYSGARKAQLPVQRSDDETALALGLELGQKVSVSVPLVVNYNGTPATSALPTASGWVDGIEHSWSPGEPLRVTLTLGYDSGASMDGVT